MKALVKNNGHVRVEDIPVPEVASGTDVIIRVAVAGLCRTDIEVAAGRIPTKDPLVLGHEFSGIVERTGGETENLHQGDRVAVLPFLKNAGQAFAEAQMLGMHADGAFAEFIRVPASCVYRMPDNMSFLAGAYMEPVAASMAVLQAAIAPQQKGLIFGDNRISRLTERVLLASGFTDISVCGKNEILPENTYDFIIETTATTDTMKEMIKAVKPGGRLVLKSRQHVPVSISIHDLVMKDIRLESVSYGDFQAGIDLAAHGHLILDDLFGDVRPLDDYAEVFATAQRGETKKLFFGTGGRDVWYC